MATTVSRAKYFFCCTVNVLSLLFDNKEDYLLSLLIPFGLMNLIALKIIQRFADNPVAPPALYGAGGTIKVKKTQAYARGL